MLCIELKISGYFFLVSNSVAGKMRMRKLNTERALPLDALPERRTERCSPRFRSGDRFCELSFR